MLVPTTNTDMKVGGGEEVLSLTNNEGPLTTGDETRTVDDDSMGIAMPEL